MYETKIDTTAVIVKGNSRILHKNGHNGCYGKWHSHVSD